MCCPVGELPITMLACARIGAVHSVVFAGFSAESLASRVEDCKSRVVVTTSEVMRGKKKLDTKGIVDNGLSIAEKNGFKVHHKEIVVYVCRTDCTWLSPNMTSGFHASLFQGRRAP